MRKILLPLLFFTVYRLLSASTVNAQCPVCTVAVGGGVVLSRYLGIDDLAVGIWIGGFVLTFGLWMATYIKKVYIKGQAWLITAFLWITTVYSLKLANFIGNPTCKIHGHDKLLTGIEAGTVAFLLGLGLDAVLRKLNKKNPGKALFPYQKVVAPVGFLIVATVIGLKICKII